MKDDAHNSGPSISLPAGVSEVDVAEIVSPPRLMTAERRAELERAEALLMADARWRGLIGELRGHAGVLARSLELAMPRDIARGVESRLNELALQELIAAEQTADAIPISRVPYAPRRSWRALITSAPARGMAVAAALALVVGGGWLLTDAVRKAWPGLPKTVVVATNDGDASPVSGVDPAETIGRDVATLAKAESSEEDALPALPEDVHTVVANDADDASPLPENAMTAERALALASEGRLGIRVRTLQAERMTNRFNRLARDPSSDWKRLRPDSPQSPAYAALWDSRPVESPAGLRGEPIGPRESSPTVVAGDPGRSVDVSGARSSPAVSGLTSRTFWTSVEALYETQVTGEAEVLEALRNSIANQWNAVESAKSGGVAGFERGVEFFELDVPPREDEVSLDPRDVLWWATPSDRWLKRVRVPVVVETVR